MVSRLGRGIFLLGLPAPGIGGLLKSPHYRHFPVFPVGMGPARAGVLRRCAGDGKGHASIRTRCFSSSVSPATASAEDENPLLPVLSAAGCPCDTLASKSSGKGENLLSFPF